MLLSICIPSYNRFGELKKLVDSILKAKSQEFDVFISDNCSPDDINGLGITDPRVHIIKRSETVSASVNALTLLNYADGEYRFICLDKDLVYGEYLDRFIGQLKLYKDVACGYCILNSEIEDGCMHVNEKPIEKSIYLGRHPSGFFLRADAVEADRKLINPCDKDSLYYNNPFGNEFMYAQGLILGREAIWNGKLVKTESREKSGKTKSYTYSKKSGNLFFLPESRKSQLNIYLCHLKELHLEPEQELRVITELCRKTLINCTFGYRSVMRDREICMHYGIESKVIGTDELRKEEKLFWEFFDGLNIEGVDLKQKKNIKNAVKRSMTKTYIKQFIKKIIRGE